MKPKQPPAKKITIYSEDAQYPVVDPTVFDLQSAMDQLISQGYLEIGGGWPEGPKAAIPYREVRLVVEGD